jgi:hypothetical protein
MVEDDGPVGGQPHVGFEPRRPQLQGPHKSGNRVLRPFRAGPSVRERDDVSGCARHFLIVSQKFLLTLKESGAVPILVM